MLVLFLNFFLVKKYLFERGNSELLKSYDGLKNSLTISSTSPIQGSILNGAEMTDLDNYNSKESGLNRLELGKLVDLSAIYQEEYLKSFKWKVTFHKEKLVIFSEGLGRRYLIPITKEFIFPIKSDD